MGRLVEGIWRSDEPRPGSSDGQFRRPETQFRNWITPDGAPGPTGDGGFPAEPGRYHLYVSMACPWAHRTLVVRVLKGLEAHIGVSGVAPTMADEGWEFSDAFPDPLYGQRRLSAIYLQADARYTGRVTVPVLWDKQRETIVSNESADIIRMLNSAFDAVGGNPHVDLYPAPLRAEIDRINATVYETVNNGVYRAGFATTQAAYDEAVTRLFTSLDALEKRLSSWRYLTGDSLTEADWRLFTTLVRFDPAYFGHFKCNIRRIVDYPNLFAYLRDLYQVHGIAETVDVDHIKRHYYTSHRSINPTGIIPAGPLIDLTAPHDRARLKAA